MWLLSATGSAALYSRGSSNRKNARIAITANGSDKK
jgi:hypothetical protein